MTKLDSEGDFIAIKKPNCADSDNEDKMPAGKWEIIQPACNLSILIFHFIIVTRLMPRCLCCLFINIPK